jgi:amino acid adenylation domain-containing protein
VIYTSGSTGQPKGAMVTQRGLVNFAIALADAINLQPGRRFLQFASFSFDASALQVFPTLISGATLVLHQDPTRLSNQELLDFCTREQVTILDLPASFWQQWVEDLAARNQYLPTSVAVCMTGGERLTRERLHTWQRLAERPVLFFSSYGPTEATITTTLFSTTSDQIDHLTEPDVPLGSKLPNTQIYLLDQQLRPVPIGVAGEVYIGGAGVARGYLGRPDLTAERFIPNPFLETNDERRQTAGDRDSDDRSFVRRPSAFVRLYRTGDLARFQEDGAIIFLGRIDDQVKLRGFRVELGEVEAALRTHPAVRETVVLVREDIADDKRLVAYVVLTNDERRTTNDAEPDSSIVLGPSSFIAELRAFLKERLPEHMLPAAVIVLDAMPLGPNGKIDRQALPAPDWAEVWPRRALLAPRDALELQLTQIWEEVLKVHPIGVTDNFFDLGGHSLSAVGLLARIQKQLKQDLPLSVLFAGPTVEQLAGLLRGQRAAAPASPLVRIQPLGARPPLFLIHPAGGNVLCFFKLAQQLGLDQPCYGLQSPGLEAGQTPLHAIDAMAAHYIDALRTVQPHGPYLLGGWSMGGIVAFEMAQQLSAHGHTVALLALLDTGAPQPHSAAPAPNDARLLVDVIGQEQLPLPFSEFQQLDLDAQLKIVLTCLRQAQLLPPGASLDQARRLMDVFKTNVAALASYLPQPYAGPITLFKTDAPLAAEPSAEPSAETASDDPSMGWQQLSDQPVAIYNVPGTHETLIFEPHVQVLAAQLRACLDALPLQSAH